MKNIESILSRLHLVLMLTDPVIISLSPRYIIIYINKPPYYFLIPKINFFKLWLLYQQDVLLIKIEKSWFQLLKNRAERLEPFGWHFSTVLFFFLFERPVQLNKVALFSHKKQGNKFPKDRVMIAAKTKPKGWTVSLFLVLNSIGDIGQMKHFLQHL